MVGPKELGISRARVCQTLNILKLPSPILDFVRVHHSPEYRATLTERRLRPLTAVDDESRQLALSRGILDEAIGASDAVP